MNLSAHRLEKFSDWEQLENTIGRDTFFKFTNKVFLRLRNMKVGEPPYSITNNVAPDKFDLFIKTCCVFILRNQYSHVFSEDFTSIRRVETDQEIEARFKYMKT